MIGRYDVYRQVAVGSDDWYPGKIKLIMVIIIRNFCLGLHSLKQTRINCSLLCHIEVVAKQKLH